MSKGTLTVAAEQETKAPNERDRRYLPRWSVDNRALYRSESEQTYHECHTVDINCVGICIYTKKELKVAQKLRLTVYLAADISIHVYGSVLWVKPEENHFLAGVTFVETSQDVQNLILSHAFEFKQEDLVNHWFKGWDDK